MKMKETMFNQKSAISGENTTGYINGFSVSSLIQALEIERKTCTLEAQANGKKGFLYLNKGVVLDAETDELSGEAAAVLILGWENAQIKLVDVCNKTKKDIQSSLTRLILDAFRRKDELNAASGYTDELSKAIRLIEGNHFKKAHAIITSYLKTNPNSSRAWLWYSRCLGSLPAISKALANCHKLTPKNLQVIEEINKFKLASEHVKDAQVRRCPFCWSPLDRKASTCHYCKSRLVISQALMQNTLEEVKSKFLIDSVTRYTDVVARENNLNAVFYLSLANCNFNKVEEALDLLNEASRNNPDNKFLSDQLNIVINHVATRLTKYEKSPTLKTVAPALRPSLAQTTKKKILVVEDSSTTRKVIVLTLKQKGYVLVEAQDGLEALSKIDEERPDLVLLDIILPKMDGYRILSIIKKSPELKDTPVILLTSKDGLMDKVRGKLAGSTAYLTKPFEPKDLIEMVRKHIG
jgi:twitching motility two-component system response regulator PilG